MKTKSLIVAVLCIALMVLSIGCGASPSQSSETSPSASADKPLKFAWCAAHQTNDFQTTIANAAKAEGEKLGVEVVIFDGKNDAATQIGQIESAVDQGYDGIAFEPINVDAVAQVVKYANDHNVPIINVVGSMTDWQNNVAAYVGGDNVTAGNLEMSKVVELLGGKGNIAIINGPMGSDPQIQRHKGYDEVLAKNPDIKVVCEDAADWQTDKALTIVENWLQSGKDINAIVVQNDGMAVGAGKAVKDSGLPGIIITGIDATSDGINAIKSGMMTGTVSQDPAGQATMGIDTLYKVVKGETLDKNDIRTQNVWIDSSNAK